jgi:putative DNA methylase
MAYRKKMIEVAIPLDAINKQSAREKSIRHGHPSTLHLWWARRPLAACRAVLFTSLIDDPEQEGVPQALLDAIDALPTPLDAIEADTPGELRRKKLFAFIGELVKWENTTNETVIGKARELILAATDGNPPPVLDPFCGGGSIPLEAQRLGLKAYASDLNPVAVLITKALIEIPPKFAGRPPVNPEDRRKMGAGVAWKGAAGLAADVRYYGKWMWDRAWERIGHLYPKGPNGETVIAWLWARTVKCPNPACGGQMPLVRSFWLSTKKGKEAWVEPIVDKAAKTVRFEARTSGRRDDGMIRIGTKNARGAKFTCPICGQPADDQHIKDEGMAGRMGRQLMAVVAEGARQRVYLSPSTVDDPGDPQLPDLRGLDAEIADDPRNIWCKQYGLFRFADLFTPRQLVALTTFSDLVGEARALAREHAVAAGMAADSVGIADGGTGAEAYADAVATYLALAVDRLSSFSSSLCWWQTQGEFMAQTFVRQALPMVWDFAEVNAFSSSSGNWDGAIEWIGNCLGLLPHDASSGVVRQLDAASTILVETPTGIATDPPYYDNIGYADLSDFFYVWMRRSLGRIYPSLFSTLLTPKEQELVATPYRFAGNKTKAEQHFEMGLARSFELMRRSIAGDLPLSVYYAFKQSEDNGSTSAAISSKGWETMLSGLVAKGFRITATWPMRTERPTGVKVTVNALASSVVLACRPRPEDAPLATLQEFRAALKAELPEALAKMIGEHIAPVDLTQAAIGPGMAVFSRYSKVLEPNGEAMTVRRALELTNETVEEYFAEREGAFDADTQFCTRWFEQRRFNEGPFGEAEVMAKAKNISVDALARDGVLTAKAGKVQLAPMTHYVETLDSYNPATDRRLTAWESCHYLAAALNSGGVTRAGALARQLGGMTMVAKDLAYRLYLICERKKWAEEALAYNALADSWADISKHAAGPEQRELM